MNYLQVPVEVQQLAVQGQQVAVEGGQRVDPKLLRSPLIGIQLLECVEIVAHVIVKGGFRISPPTLY